jgi:hypothetical protein
VNEVVFLYRTPLDSWSDRPEEAPDLITALRRTLKLFSGLYGDSATVWAARREEDLRYPYRADERLGGADLFRCGKRAVHVVGDTQVAAEARQALGAGDILGWDLQPVRPSNTPLHVLQPLLGTRYYGLLSRNGFSNVEEVEATPDSGLLALRNAGAKFIDAVRTAIADLGLGELADTRIVAPSTPEDTARRRQLITRQLEPGAALRNRDFIELLARSSIPPTALRLIIDTLNAEPPPPADPAVVAILDTAGETELLGYYTRSRGGEAAAPPAPR